MVRKSLFVLVAVLLAAIPLTAQTSWMKNYGGEGSETGWVVEQTTDGGYFVLGTTSSFGAGEADIWLLKTDSSGDTLWTKTYGGSLTEWASSGQLTSDGGYIIAGYTESFGAGKYDIWLLKTDSSGDTVWTQTYGDTGYEEANSVQRTTDGGYIITGYNNGVFNEEYGYVRPGDIWLIKTDDGGNLLWEKTYGTPEDEYEEGMCVRQTSDGGYIIVGETQSFAPGMKALWLLKTDAEGDTAWSRVYGGEIWDRGECVQETEDGGYILLGSTSSFATGIQDFWLLKTDAQGDTLWTHTYGGDSMDIGHSVQQTSDRGYILTGRAYPSDTAQFWDVWLLKTDAYGDTLWTRFYGTDLKDGGCCVQQTSDGGYVVVGFTDFPKACNRGNLWLLKTDEGGDTLWTRTYGEIYAPDYGSFVQQTSDGGYIVTGWTDSYDIGGKDLWVIKTNDQGDSLWTRIFGGTGFESGICVQETSDRGYILTGSTDSYGAGGSDLWLIKTDSLGFVETVQEEPIADAPADWQVLSPIGKRIVLRYEDRPQGFSASVFDVSGRTVDEIHSTADSGTISWGDTAPTGVYFIKEVSNHQTRTQKVIIIN